jgi:hypothetical protein
VLDEVDAMHKAGKVRSPVGQTQFIACHPPPSATKYDRKFAPPVPTGAPRNCKSLAIVCHDHV